ncbi:unnamed protein product [Adineta ricciae]|uniref:Cysteine-rich DPF motif domain-containing protein 1 n=1 Tax=Adineta ricciae TaxID=249248 RepID=A0A813YCA2_ADIRI|nr:unnamed protein product [Adineta ricciae]
MAEEEAIEPKVFQCSLCPFYAAYDRYDSQYIDDSNLPTTQSSRSKKDSSLTINLLEKVYLLRDPFVAMKEKDKEDQSKLSSVILGGLCSVCSCPICVHSDCSVFYTRRFCLRCVAKYQAEFPREVLDEIGAKRLEKFTHEAECEQYDDDV